MPYNSQQTLIAQGSYTTTQTSPVIENAVYRGVMLGLHVVTNPGGVETLTVNLSFVGANDETDQVVGTQVTVGTGTGTYRLIWYPGASSTPDGSRHKAYAQRLARRWKVSVVPSASGVWVYRLDADMLD